MAHIWVVEQHKPGWKNWRPVDWDTDRRKAERWKNLAANSNRGGGFRVRKYVPANEED